MRLAIPNDLSGTVDSMSAALGEVGVINRTEISVGIAEKAMIVAVGVLALPDDLSGITTAPYTVNITRTGGFTGAVTFSASGLPAGATPTFSPNPASGASSSVTIATAANTAPGTYPFTISGSSGSLTRTTSATLVVTCTDGEC